MSQTTKFPNPSGGGGVNFLGGTLKYALQLVHGNNKKDDESERCCAMSIVTYSWNYNRKFNHYRAQESSPFLSSLLLNTLMLLSKKSPDLEEARVWLNRALRFPHKVNRSKASFCFCCCHTPTARQHITVWDWKVFKIKSVCLVCCPPLQEKKE